MKIVEFVVRVECGHCKGAKMVPGGQREYGEVVPCTFCRGRGTKNEVLAFEKFVALVQALARGAR